MSRMTLYTAEAYSNADLEIDLSAILSNGTLKTVCFFCSKRLLPTAVCIFMILFDTHFTTIIILQNNTSIIWMDA